MDFPIVDLLDDDLSTAWLLVYKGEPTAAIAREIGVTRQTAHDMRKAIQANAERLQPQEALPDQRTETDEMFQNAGKKGNVTTILMIHPGGGPTSGGDMAPTTMIDQSNDMKSIQENL